MLIDPISHSFDRVVIRRSGGIAGVDETLTVSKDLTVTVDNRRTGDRSFQLDAVTARELVNALGRVATERPAPSTASGRDMFGYDIELTWNGKTYRVHSVDVGADDALHGVMFAANRLMAPDFQAPFHTMELHDVPHEEPTQVGVGSKAGTVSGNGGVVPPWLQ